MLKTGDRVIHRGLNAQDTIDATVVHPDDKQVVRLNGRDKWVFASDTTPVAGERQ